MHMHMPLCALLSMEARSYVCCVYTILYIECVSIVMSLMWFVRACDMLS